MRGFIPSRYEIVVFSFFLSMLMSFLVSGISTIRTLGITDTLLTSWASNFISSWLVAFPSVMVVAPIVRRLVRFLIRDEKAMTDDRGENLG
jgi:phosphotransferase system  glucose/maltose/N-acetylglucosamine-specific IIC component